MGRTRPEGYPIMGGNDGFRQNQKKPTSTSFIVALSVILGIIISAGTIFSALGKAFYVSRSEYNEMSMKNAEDTTTFKQTLNQIGKVLSRQETAFEKLSDSVEGIKIDMASARRK